MTSRERVKKAIRFETPDVIPINFSDEGGNDIMWVSVAQRPKTNGKNEWGVEYETLSDAFGEPKVFPFKDIENFDECFFPDFTENWRYEHMNQSIQNNKNDQYVLGMMPMGFFLTMIDLFGFMDFMCNVGGNIKLIEDVSEKLCNDIIKCTTKMAECGVDGIILIDDTALQDTLMVSMETFNTVFKPRYKRIFDCAHNLGLDTFVHSCGYVIDIIDEFIDAGLDVINLDQQDNMGIDNLAKRYKGRICFYNPIDIQRTVSDTKEQIDVRVTNMINAFATKSGGFIAKTYPQPEAIDMSSEYVSMVKASFKDAQNIFNV